MKNYSISPLLLIFTFVASSIFTTSLFGLSNPIKFPAPEPVQVSDQDAVFLFRYVGGPFDGNLPEDLENQILHSDLMMCSILFKMGNKITARCLLPAEQIKFEKDNATEVTQIMKKYGMPSHFKFGYETVEGGLDCTNALSGKEYPKCFLTAKSLE